MSSILRIALGAAMIALAAWPRFAQLLTRDSGLHFALLALWLIGGVLIGDGLQQASRRLSRQHTESPVVPQ